MSTGPTVQVDKTYATVEIASGGATVTVDVPETTVSITAPGPQGPAGTGADGYILQAYDTTDQTAASTTTAYPILLGTTDISDGITVANNGSSQPTRITFANDGDYNIQFSIQFQNSGADDTIANVWFRKNGTDIPQSNSQTSIPKKHGGDNGSLILAANLIVEAAAGDYVELYWQTEATTVSIQALSAGTTPTTPATPSVIVTAMVNRYLEVGPAGPGVATGGTTGQVLTKASASDYDTTWSTPGLTKLSSQTVTGGTGGTSIPNLFSNTYKNYRIVFANGTASQNTYLSFRLAASGTPNSTASSYARRGTYAMLNTLSVSSENESYCFLGFIGTGNYIAGTGDFINPKVTGTTVWVITMIDRSNDAFTINGRHTVSGSYDGLYLYSNAGTFSIDITVYGYN